MNESGWVVIGTKLDTKQLEKDLRTSQRQLQQYEKEAKRLTEAKVRVDLDLKPYREEKALIEKFTDSNLKYANTTSMVEKTLAREKQHMDQLNETYAKQLLRVTEINRKLEENKVSQALAKQNIEEATKKLALSQTYEGINDSVSSISSGMTNIVRKVARWGLAIFSVRTAYSLITRAMSILSETNENLAARLQGIRITLATALEPIIMRIVSLIERVVGYIAYLYERWFGIDLYAKSTAKALKIGAGSAEKMRKSLMGFDEMNVLGDNVGASGGSGGGIAVPEVLTSGDRPKWLEKIVDIGKWIIENPDLFFDLMLSLKMISDLLSLNAGGLLFDFIMMIVLHWDDIKAFFSGLWEFLKWFFDFDRNWDLVVKGWEMYFDWNDDVVEWGANLLEKIFEGIKNAWNKNWDLIIEGWKKYFDWNSSLVENGAALVEGLIEGMKSVWQKIADFFSGIITWFKEKFGIHSPSTVFESFGEDIIKGLVNGFNSLWNKITEFFLGIITWFKEKFGIHSPSTIFEGFGKNIMQGLIDGVSSLWSKLTGIFNGLPAFFSGIVEKIKGLFSNIGTKVSESIGSSFKNVINTVLSNVERILNRGINTINSLVTTVNKIPGINLGKLNTISLPRLAKGGIINLPGRGVPIGGAIAGEAGREAVLPLQDTQVLNEIADAIGRRITINANITTTMNGRVISRELQRIQNENDFAYNR